MPKNPTIEQRLKWHREHEKHCACRPRPKELQIIQTRNKRRRNGSSLDSKKRIVSVLKRNKDVLKELYDITELGIFGSYVRREQTRRSDVDIVVDFGKVPDLITFVAIEGRLSELLRHEVDLIDKKGIRPELREPILSEVEYI
ncbi:MAG: nucleotidyltransferase family protein [Ignavibacteriae bacterium]|nr:nucleotidyltransferase family protein [Ignavibacteriota bacterium]